MATWVDEWVNLGGREEREASPVLNVVNEFVTKFWQQSLKSKGPTRKARCLRNVSLKYLEILKFIGH